MRYQRNPVQVEAVQWFPPEDPRHAAIATPIRFPDTDCLYEGECPHDDCTEHPHGPVAGDIGEQGGKYWCRTEVSAAVYLKPGMWIVRTPVCPWVEVLTEQMFWDLYSGPI